MNSDIEATELAIAETKLETEKFKGQGVSTDTQRKRVLKELEEKLEKTTAAADAYERKHQAASKTIGQLKTGIHSIFSRLGGTTAAVEKCSATRASPNPICCSTSRSSSSARRKSEQYAAPAGLHSPPARHVRDRRRHAPRQQDCGGAAGLRRHGRGRRGGGRRAAADARRDGRARRSGACEAEGRDAEGRDAEMLVPIAQSSCSSPRRGADVALDTDACSLDAIAESDARRRWTHTARPAHITESAQKQPPPSRRRRDIKTANGYTGGKRPLPILACRSPTFAWKVA